MFSKTIVVVVVVVFTLKAVPSRQSDVAGDTTKEIDRAHRSHSTREAKQNETNKKNQGSPIKTIKTHDSILAPLLGRGVFTAGFTPARLAIYSVRGCQSGTWSAEQENIRDHLLERKSSYKSMKTKIKTTTQQNKKRQK